MEEDATKQKGGAIVLLLHADRVMDKLAPTPGGMVHDKVDTAFVGGGVVGETTIDGDDDDDDEVNDSCVQE